MLGRGAEGWRIWSRNDDALLDFGGRKFECYFERGVADGAFAVLVYRGNEGNYKWRWWLERGYIERPLASWKEERRF